VQRHGLIDVEAEDIGIRATENVEEGDEKRSCLAVSYGSRERWGRREDLGARDENGPRLECPNQKMVEH
jgi:hypothetical protein